MLRRIAMGLGIAAMILMALSVLGLWNRDDPDGTIIDRGAEMWAHERLMAATKGIQAKPFVTDGCSGGMSAIWRKISDDLPTLTSTIGDHPPWENCCIAHDRAYNNAGGATNAEQSFRARRIADQNLYSCISEHEQNAAGEALANATYLAVRAAGGPCSGLDWRWGYGLPKCFDLSQSAPQGD